MQDMVGKWAFIIGVVLAIIAGFVAIPFTAFVLAVLGLVVGFLNITTKETNNFLMAAIALLVLGAASLGAIGEVTVLKMVAEWVESILTNIIAFVAPAALVVSLEAIYKIGQK